MQLILAPSASKFVTLLITSCSWVLASEQLRAQAPVKLQRSIAAPPVGIQSGAQLGFAVAVDGDLTVVGAPLDDLLGVDSGAVKVFNSNTGELLYVLPNPDGVPNSQFGHSVGICGTRVVVGTGSASKAFVYDLSSSTPTSPVATLNDPVSGSSNRFGTAVAIFGTRVVVGARSDSTGGNGSGTVYVYDLGSGTPASPVATLTNPSPLPGDEFGYSVAISGTGLVVGARSDDTGAGNAGSAYVYDFSNGTPMAPAVTLNNPAPAVTDHFGNSVAISGTRVVVGAWLNNDQSGSAYVYDLSSGTPTVPMATLNNPGPSGSHHFGRSVAISGTRVVVAWFDQTASSGSGRAYVYELSSGTPTVPVSTLSIPNGAFGWCVAISGTRVVVGDPFANTGAPGAGGAYVYDFSGGAPTGPVALNNPGPAPGDEFGRAVAISGTRMVVGARFDDTGATNAGSAYVYDLSSATPTVPVATLNNPTPAAGDEFGWSVAISGARVVVGTRFDDAGADDAGTAYVYDLSSGSPTVPVLTLSDPAPAAGDWFGHSVAISGTHVVVGALLDDTQALSTGRAFVYDLSSGTPTVPVATLNSPVVAPDGFGESVAMSGTRIVVAAPYNDTGGDNAGSVYVYDLSSGMPTAPVATLRNPLPAAHDWFGISVAISGTRVVVGAWYDDTTETDAGSAYVYDLSTATPTLPVRVLLNPNPGWIDLFGCSVGISGTRVVVGAYLDDTGATDTGSAYVYELSSGTPTVPAATLNNPTPAPTDLFGWSVAISGLTVVVSAPFDDSPQAEKGSAYVYAPGLSALSAVSRKTHGAAGEFDVPLPFTGEPGVESRSAGANGTHRFVVEFTNAVTQGTASVDGGTIVGSPSFAGRTITIDVTGLPNATRVTLTLTNVRDIFDQTLPSATVPMNLLLGDSTGNKAVNGSDISQTKAFSGSAATPNTLRADFNADGNIGASDISQVKAAAGTFVP